MSLYFVEGYRTDDVRIRRGVLREDGLVSVHARFDGGQFVTRPLVFAGNTLTLNCSTSAAGSVRVELQDFQGHPISGYALGDCEEIYGDELARIVSWNNYADVSSLAGRTIRLRLELRDADLFSLRFQK
jgi:hypothetical protein